MWDVHGNEGRWHLVWLIVQCSTESGEIYDDTATQAILVSRVNWLRCHILLMELHSPLKPWIMWQPGGLVRRVIKHKWIWHESKWKHSFWILLCTQCRGRKHIYFSRRYRLRFAVTEFLQIGYFFWPNCCQWLNPIHLHRSPLKRDADELNECANYAHSEWGACCYCNFVCVCASWGECVRVHIWDFMLVHARVFVFIRAGDKQPDIKKRVTSFE